MSKESEKYVYTVEQARQQLGISRGLAYEGIRTGQIPSIRIGRRILVPKAALQRIFDNGKESTSNS